MSQTNADTRLRTSRRNDIAASSHSKVSAGILCLLLACVASSCDSASAVPLRDVARGAYPRDSAFTVAATIIPVPDVHVPFSRTSVRSLVSGSDTVLAVVPDSVANGPVRLCIRAYQSEILNIPLGRL